MMKLEGHDKIVADALGQYQQFVQRNAERMQALLKATEEEMQALVAASNEANAQLSHLLDLYVQQNENLHKAAEHWRQKALEQTAALAAHLQHPITTSE